jgi:drug/metabolite transporter (DMT)-like permease
VQQFLGMGITLLGIVLVMSTKLEIKRDTFGKTLKMGPLVLGSILALGGAAGQAAGLVLSKKAMRSMTIGSFTGPFLGVSFSLLAVQHTDTGIAATLMALTPVMIIPAAIWMKKEKIRALDVIGSVVSVGGVALFFL